MSKKICGIGWAILIAMAAAILFAVALSCGFSSRGASAEEVAPSEKLSYDFHEENYEFRLNDEEVGVYYVGEAEDLDLSVSFRYVATDASGEDVKADYSEPYFAVGTEEGLTAVGIQFVRAADEEYMAFESDVLPLEKNTDSEIIKLPYPYEETYDGTEKSYDNVTFSGAESVLNAGTYIAELGYETPIRISYRILPAAVTVGVNSYFRVYLEEDTYEPELTVRGNVSEADVEYIAENSEYTLPDVDIETSVGTYDVKVAYTGDSENYNVSCVDGKYIVKPACMTGFSLKDLDVLYDGKPHRPELVYDSEKWCDLDITFNYDEMSEVGRYRYRCVIKKRNYTDLVVESTMRIRSRSLEGSGEKYQIQMSGNAPMGYDPGISIALVESKVEGLEDLAAPLLKEETGYKESVIGSYDVDMMLDGRNLSVEEDNYSLRLRLYGLTSANGIRILKYEEGALEEADYTFENGYFVLQTTSLEGIVFVKNFAVSNSSPANLIAAIIIGAVLLLVLIAIIAALVSGGRNKRYWRRRHSRWA